VEQIEYDAFWGDGGGKNRLGQVLMPVPKELRLSP
jgi:predicted NAD-dependent protein-ADP-ribosyltransferase YbiA (DUF1768 family)